LPVSRGIVFGGGVAGGDSGLEMVFAHRIACGSQREVVQAARDHRVIPARTVLLVEAQ